MTTIEHGFACDFEEKAVQETADHFVVTGYAAVFGNTDLVGDVIVPGSFKKSLTENPSPLLLYNHDMSAPPLGTIVECREDRKGLWYRAELPRDDDFVRGRIVPQLKRRGIRSNSIGYRVTKKNMRSDGVRELREIKLIEISIVNLPANPLASVESVKGDRPIDPALRRALESFVRCADEIKGRDAFAKLMEAKNSRPASSARRLEDLMQDLRQIASGGRR